MTNQKNKAQVVQEYSNTVYRLAFAMLQNKSDADDVYQEVFFAVRQKTTALQRRAARKGVVSSRNVQLRKEPDSFSVSKRTKPLLEGHGSYSMDEKSMQVREMVRTLAPKYRRVIHLFYFEDMTVAQMSSVLGIKQTTIRSQLSRARELLKSSAKGEGYEF